jgi:acetyl-CoA/propionyl-CoA carboxylase biotin carboxyl carrier protein
MNTRLQVEHPVTEETAGIDIVREQFRIAAGEKINFTANLRPRRHSFEFRINAEDPGRGFLPATGRLAMYSEPGGPGVRVDTGVAEGDVVAGEFDSMLAKLIVTAETRQEALERARLALNDFRIEGIPTVLPFHRLVVDEPDFTGDDCGFGVHTRWIEEQWNNPLEPQTVAAPSREELARQQLSTAWVEIDGRRSQLRVSGGLFGFEESGGRTTGATPRPRPVRRKRQSELAAFSGRVVAPMGGTVVRLEVQAGQEVEQGAQIAALEAMKMEYLVVAPVSGVITSLERDLGDVVNSGETIATMGAWTDDA